MNENFQAASDNMLNDRIRSHAVRIHKHVRNFRGVTAKCTYNHIILHKPIFSGSILNENGRYEAWYTRKKQAEPLSMDILYTVMLKGLLDRFAPNSLQRAKRIELFDCMALENVLRLKRLTRLPKPACKVSIIDTWISSGLSIYLKAMASSKIVQIRLSYCLLSLDQLSLIAHSSNCKAMKNLSLFKSKIKADHIEILSQNRSWDTLVELNLRSNLITDRGVGFLSQNTIWCNLQQLHLSDNQISNKGVEYLSQNKTWKKLMLLDLSVNFIEDQGIESLVQNDTWVNLQRLNLFHNRIGVAGAQSLACKSIWKDLRHLDLSENRVGKEGASFIARNTSWLNLKILNLDRNSIDDDGAELLVLNQTWSKLLELTMSGNNLSHVRKQLLLRTLKTRPLLMVKF